MIRISIVILEACVIDAQGRKGREHDMTKAMMHLLLNWCSSLQKLELGTLFLDWCYSFKIGIFDEIPFSLVTVNAKTH